MRFELLSLVYALFSSVASGITLPNMSLGDYHWPKVNSAPGADFRIFANDCDSTVLRVIKFVI